MAPTLKDIETDEGFLGLPPDAQDRIRLGFLQQFILPDEGFKALQPEEKSRLASRVMNIREPSALGRLVELVPEIPWLQPRPESRPVSQPTAEDVALASGGMAPEAEPPSRMRPFPAPPFRPVKEAEAIAAEERLRRPVPFPPLVAPPGIPERPEQPRTEAELRREGSVVGPVQRRTLLQTITESKPGTAIASAWAELPEMKIAQALGAAGVDVATKEQLAEDLGANPTLLDKTLQSATMILGSPLSMAAFAWGAVQVPARAVQASLARLFGPRVASETMAQIVAGSATTAQKFATFEGVSNASQQLAHWRETGEAPSVPQLAKSMGKGAAVGAAMGPTAMLPGRIARGAGAAGVLATAPAAMEGRLPTVEDLIEAGTLVATLGLTHALPEAVSKALSTPAAQRTPQQRAIVDQVKRGLEPIRRVPIGEPQARAEEALGRVPAEIAPPSGEPAVTPPTPEVGRIGEGVTPLTPEVLGQVTDAIMTGLREVSGMKAPLPEAPRVQEPPAPRAWPISRVLQAPDGSMVRVTVRADGQSIWQEMTNPRSKRRAAAEGAITQITGDEFSELMGRKRGLTPEDVTGIRQQFLRDEALMPAERGGRPPEPPPEIESAPPVVAPRPPEAPAAEPARRPPPAEPTPAPATEAAPAAVPPGVQVAPEAPEAAQTPIPIPPQAPAPKEGAIAPAAAAPVTPEAPEPNIRAEIERLRAENARLKGEAPAAPRTVLGRLRRGSQSKPVSLGQDSTLQRAAPVGKQKRGQVTVAIGEQDAEVLSAMRETAGATQGAEGRKVFVSRTQETREGAPEALEVNGWKTGKPEWMGVPEKPGAYYETRDVLKVLESLKQGKWPTTAERERIADQIMEAVRSDAEREKARIAEDKQLVAESDRVANQDAERQQAIEQAFYREVDRLAREETGNVTQTEDSLIVPGWTPLRVGESYISRNTGVRVQVTGIDGDYPKAMIRYVAEESGREYQTNAEAAGRIFEPLMSRPAEPTPRVAAQPEMFTGREMIERAITPGKKGTEVPQAATGDELLAGMRPPEAERQLTLAGGGFAKDQRVRYRPKPNEPSIRGRVLSVNPDGTLDFRADAGGIVRGIPITSERLKPESGRAGASAMAAVNVAELPSGSRARPTGPPSFRQRILEARAQPPPTAVSQTARAVNEARDDIRRVLAPASRSAQAKEASLVLREHLSGDLAQRTARASAALESARRFFGAQDAGPNMAWFDRAERGEVQPTEQLASFNATVRSLLDTRRQDVQNLGEGKLQTFYEHYMPHIYAEPETARKFFVEWFSKRPIEGTKAFLKERKIPTMLDAMFPKGPPEGWARMNEADLRKAIHEQGGLEPASYNPVDMVLRRVRQMDRFILSHRAIAELESMGPAFLKYKPVFEDMPEGYTRINDAAFRAYGKPTITVKEAYDKQVVDKLQRLMADLGITHERKPRIGGSRWGFALEGERMTTKFAGPESVIMHELGHNLDARYDLWRRLVGEVEAAGKRGEVTKGASQKEREGLRKELRALADLRYEGQEPEKAYREYVRRKEEQMANAFMALLYAPERMAKVAPKIKGRLEAFLSSRPELKPILDIKPSLVLGEGATEIPTGGLLLHGEWVAPEPVARLINNFLSPGLRERSGLFRAYLGVGNMLNQFQLGYSAFHLGFTTLDAATSKFALGIYQAAHGEPLAGLTSLLKTPTAAFTGIVQGDRILKEYYRPGTQPAELATIADGVRLAGGRVHMDKFYRTNLTERMMDAFRAAMQPGRTAASRLGKGIGGILRAPFALTEQAIRPVLEYIVPRQKLAVFADMYRTELERLGPEATKPQIREAAATAWDSADNRMGQLVYDNLFWNKTVKDVALASIRSVGWNLGTWRELGGGVRDIPQLAKGDLSFRASYVLALPIMTGVLGATLQYLWTGKGPEELRDYFFPRTGTTDDQGRPERVSLPTYMKDIYHYWKEPFRTVANKVHPALGFMGDILENRDFYGTKIRNEDDPLIQQMQDVAKHVATTFTPIAVRQLQQQRTRGEGIAKQALPFIGITQAPAAVVRSDAENRAVEYLRAKTPEGSRTREEAARSQALAQIRRDTRLSREPMEKAREAVREGVASSQDVLKAMREAKKDFLERAVPRLSASEALNVYGAATEEERRKIRSMVASKVSAARSKPQEWTESVERMARALGFMAQSAPSIIERMRQRRETYREGQSAP